MNKLSNFEIMDIIKDMNLDSHFAGVYSKDKLPTELLWNKFYIINLQDSDAGGGTHWCVFYYNAQLTSIFFDSYGFPGPIEVEQKIKPNIYNDAEVQNIDSSACGYFCLAFIKYIHNKADKQEAYKTFLKLI